MSKLIRSRWAAIGAAVAVTLGAGGGFGLARATVSSGERTVLVGTQSCRLSDTRSTIVDPRATPLQPGETYVLTAHGNNGQCTGIPADAVALQLNVTALDATASTFFTIWGDGSLPNASSLNPAPGQPPTPNAVTTDLTAAGHFNIFNSFGTVNVLVDITGYYAATTTATTPPPKSTPRSRPIPDPPGHRDPKGTRATKATKATRAIKETRASRVSPVPTATPSTRGPSW